jgi:predicted HTH transcriptional regulator
MAAHLYRLNDNEFAHILSTFPLVDAQVKQAAMDEFVTMRDSGKAATFNPDLAKPAVSAAVDPARAVRELIKAGESATVEFKSTARWNVKINQPDKKMEQIIVKTIAAFLNTHGGTLVIGVEDNGNIYGLAEDYQQSGNKGRDGFELWLMQTLLKDFGKDAAGQIDIAFHELKAPDPEPTPPAPIGSGDVCVVTVKLSPKPRFVVENGQELFYIRTGNATNQLKPSELLGYCKQRWPETVAAG